MSDYTREHIAKVQSRIHECTNNLTVRASRHDASKLIEPEKSGFAEAANIDELTYGQPEYQASLDALKDALAHHYAVNTHHPEHWPNGINGMSLLDIVEMFCDWQAAGERTKHGSMERSLRVNKERFKIDDQLASIFENTCKEMGW